jgi:polysaccharide chain length determinant protein (PEP-CTERM system associated)
MIPGKKYKPEDFLQIGWRHRWLILLPLAAVAIGATLYAYSLPEQWMSTAMIQVVPQQVPEAYVRSTVTGKIDDRLDSIKQLILSRTRLEAIIQEFNLYPGERRTGLMEDIVERMRSNDIGMAVVKGDAFRISFVSNDPRLAMRVTERLTSLFISENLKDREVIAERSSQFLESELETVRLRLEETEHKLAAYRRQYSGQLPDQVQTNLQALGNLQMQIQTVSDSINRDREQRLFIQRQIADLTNTPLDDPTGATPPSATGGQPGDANGGANDRQTGGSAADQLESARARLRVLELRLKPEHPDVIAAKRYITDLERKAEAEALQQPLSATAAPVRVSPGDTAKRNRLREYQSQLANLDTQITRKQTEESRLRTLAGGYQVNVQAAPTRESELTSLTRDYTTLSEQYRALLTKNQDAKMSANLERRQGGEQFRLLDPARIPERPFSPNRPRLMGMGLVAGLGLGLGLVALLEYRDRSLRTDEDVMLALALPVLAIIPQMSNTRERQVERRRLLMLSAAGAATFACAVLVFVWKFVQWRHYLPW